MKNLWIGFLAIASMTALAAGSDPIETAGQGSLMSIDRTTGDPIVLSLPLKHTAVDAEITGFIARVTVVQEFQNPALQGSPAIEAIYVFPLPDMSAVDDMTMTIGDKAIKGVIKKRSEAEEIYLKARDAGRTAALLTQERPNIFTQSVANILPGDSIRITISYVQDLKYDDGGYEFNFPMVVGPRFIPGEPSGRSGGGWSPDTTSVPDASRITPPVLRPGERSGHDIELRLTADAGVPVTAIRSPSHRIILTREGNRKFSVDLDRADSIPNKDFILRYDTAGGDMESGILTHARDDGGFFSLIIQPKAEFDTSEVTPKEMVFVVDCSGSMMGAPIQQAKAAMKKCIAGLNPDDTFQVIQFSNAASGFAPAPVPNTPQNVQRALRFIDDMQGEGGTMMIAGIRAALDYPHDPQRLRMVLFMTDGYIGNETEIFSEINKRLGNSRLFSFGVGTSVNHYLLDNMAKTGRGFVQYVRPDEDTTQAVDLFYERISNPLLTDISIDWNGLDVEDMYPAVIPDLFSSQPVIVHGRYGDSGTAAVIIRGRIRGTPWEEELKVVFPGREPEHDVLATLWARSRIESLSEQMYQGENQRLVDEITSVALKYRIMSKYTAFVAVSEEVRRSADGTIQTVQVPVEMPEMVSYEGVFGEETCDKLHTVGYMAVPQAPSGGAVRCMKSKSGWGRPACETAASLPECKDERADRSGAHQKQTRKTGIEIQVRMISGDWTAEMVRKAFESISDELLAECLSAGISRLTVSLKTSDGNLRVEFASKDPLEDAVMETFRSKVLSAVSRSGLRGSAVVELTVEATAG